MSNTNKEISDSPLTDSNVLLHQQNIDDLAKELAYNYYSNSFGDEFNLFVTRSSDIFKETDSIVQSFKEKIGRKERVRNILIVGAGASNDSYKAIPTGFGLIDEIKDLYETDIRTIDFLRDKFDSEAQEILDITGKPELNFENYLYLLSNFFVTQKDLREKIKGMTGFRYSVSLFNEIVAHMLKHAFLDVVINFNFEETLDHAIEEEIGKGNYHNIISDGNTVALEQVLVDGRLKVPIYIKPHGTFSHKSTLRFTNRHYFDLPNDIKIMLEGLISGKRGEIDVRKGKKEIQRVNLICVGFAIQSLEFNKILDNCLPPESVIYHLDWDQADDPKKFFKDRSLQKFIKRTADHGRRIDERTDRVYRSIYTKDFSQNRSQGTDQVGNQLTTPFGEIFSALWRVTYAFFQDSYKPRSIARHEILSYLFYEPKMGLSSLRGENTLDQRRLDRKYLQLYNETHPKLFRNRLLVELALAINRSNGIIDITELLKGKIGFYYKKYEEACESFPGKIRGKSSIFDIVNQFSLKRTLVSTDPLTQGSFAPFVEEYKNGKNLFSLLSLFQRSTINDPKTFEDVIDRLKIDLKIHFESLHVEPDDPINFHPDLTRKIEVLSTNFKDILMDWKSKISGEYEITRFERTVTVFYLLITSPLLSRHFKINFIDNFSKLVYNGKEYGPKDLPCIQPQTMLCELFRLLSKSASLHYFVIDPLPYSPVHYIWESFKRRNLIHTILGLTSEFNHLFEQGSWDALLLISETGSLLNFMHKIDESKKTEIRDKSRYKQVVVICSFEAVKQLYPETDDIHKIIIKHKKYIAGQMNNGETILTNLTVLLVHFNQHNHHTTIFLKSIAHESYDSGLGTKFTILSNHKDDSNGKKVSGFANTYYFNAIGSLYNYRQGFSNSIDPIHIGLVDIETTSPAIHNDQEKMIDIFVLHLARAFRFELFPPRNSEWEKDKFLRDLQRKYKMNPEIKLDSEVFLLCLYKHLRKLDSKHK